MKKLAVLGICGGIAVLGGCCHTCDKAQQVTEPTDVNIIEQAPVIAAPCSYSCMPNNPCIQTPEPMVLKPRVVETIADKKRHKRPCCDNDISPEDSLQTYVPDAPEIYVISANRTVNSMLAEAQAFFKQAGNIKIYIDKEDMKSSDLPGGMSKGTQTLHKRFANIKSVTLVDNIKQADYIVGSTADWYDTATKTVPAIKYDLLLKDKNGQVFGEWSEIIHQANGDRSWW